MRVARKYRGTPSGSPFLLAPSWKGLYLIPCTWWELSRDVQILQDFSLDLHIEKAPTGYYQENEVLLLTSQRLFLLHSPCPCQSSPLWHLLRPSEPLFLPCQNLPWPL